MFQDDLKSNYGGKGGDVPSALECIDLSDPVHSATKDDRRKARDMTDSPAMTDRTEFEDPDINGRSRKKTDLKNTSLGGILLSISSIGLKLAKESGDGVHSRKKRQKGK